MVDTKPSWRIGVDIGGTFTDIVLWDSLGGQLILDKILTTPNDPSHAVLEGVERVLEATEISAQDLTSVIHGTTLVANALIERKGANTGLITTSGFRDVLEIGREWREVTVAFSELPGFDAAGTTMLLIGAFEPGDFEIEIEDIRLSD